MTDDNSKVITRIAPSPTGLFHIGTARAALFNYLYARQNNGKFIVRIEDTDTERSKKEYEEDILAGLEWLGLNHDEIFRQSDRTDIYKKYLNQMIEQGSAYISKEEPKEEGDRDSVIRFKNPNKTITFNDEIRGEITFDTTELGDFVIAKSETEPLYHLAVVIDDHEMEITHIIRGEDGISNTPRQILIQEAIGAKLPKYAHLPLVLGKDRSKLSKRHGATSLSSFREAGYTKEAMINYLAFLGWNPGSDREIFSLDELIKEFSLNKISKGGAIFDEEKLKWFNKHYLENDPNTDSQIMNILKNYPETEKVNKDELLKIIKSQISTLSDIKKLFEIGEFDYLDEARISEPQTIIWKDDNAENTISYLEEVKNILEKNYKENIKPEEVKELIWPLAESKGKGNVLWPTRYTLSGKDRSPDPFSLVSILGIKESINRLDKAINLLK